jgi:outer membrane protein assembly factor BamB
MRFARTVALVGVGLLWLVLGPLVLLVALAALGVRQVRGWLRPTWRVVAAWVVAAVAASGLAVVVPDGWVPIPPGSGALVTPGYEGRPARLQPMAGLAKPNPHLAASSFAGPLGESPHVWTRSYGVDGCRTVSVDVHGRLVALCGSDDEPVLRLVDPESLRQLAAKDLPTREDAPCRGAFYVDDGDRAVVATHDRRLLVVRTADGDGEPDLTTETSVSIADVVPDDDCVIGVAPDWQGRTWFVSRGGRVGIAEGERVRVLDLAEQVAEPPTLTRGGLYVATAEAVLRVDAGADGRPVTTWRSAGDHPSTPAVAGDLVAVGDGDHLVVRRTSDGQEVCASDVPGRPLAVGAAFVVQDTEGYGGPLSTLLGRTASGGLARIDVSGARCATTWTADVHAPSGAAAVSLPAGLVYAYTKRHSWLGVDAWYLTALDLRTGRAVWSVRTGLGVLRDNHRGEVALGPDGSAYVPVLGGLVRVHDRD